MDQKLWQECLEKAEQDVARAQASVRKPDFGFPGSIAESTNPEQSGVRIRDLSVDPYNGLARAREK